MFATHGDPLKFDTEAVHLLTLEERAESSASASYSASEGSSYDNNLHDHFDPAERDALPPPIRPSPWHRKVWRRLVDARNSYAVSPSSPSLNIASLVKPGTSLLPAIALAILPSFVGNRFLPEQHNKPRAAVRPTAFLDGMRGVASWAVFNTHLASVLDRDSGSGWGHDENAYKFSKLPIARLLYDGRVAVCIFFVISGFALSLGPVNSMNKSPLDSASAFRRLCSATFRRPIRLFLPAFASTLIIFTFARYDVFMNIRAQLQDEHIIRGWEYLNEFPKPFPTWWDQLLDLYRNNLRLLQIFNDIGSDGFDDHYNDVLWTIAIEFRASLMLFLSHAALSFIRRPLRLTLIVVLIVASIQTWSFEMPLFWAGFLLAECWSPPKPAAPQLPHTADSADDPTPILASMSRYRRYGSAAALVSGRTVAIICVLVGSFLASTPGYEPELTPLWAWLADMPRLGYFFPGFWTMIGSIMIVASVAYIPILNGRYFFASPLIIYLGKISFSLYLVHISFVRGIGTLVFYWSYSTFGESNTVDSAVSFTVGYVLLLGLTIWVADIFCRLVEQPSMHFAKWLEAKVFRKD